MTDAEFVEPTTPEQMLLTAVTPRLEAMSDDEIAASSTATERIMEERAPTSLLRQQLADAEARIQTLRDAIARDEDDICQTLGKVLGYPWYKDDQKNFPGATEADGVCVGEHVAASIAAEAARRVRELEEAGREMMTAANELMTEFVSRTRAAHWGLINDALVKMGNALARRTP